MRKASQEFEFIRDILDKIHNFIRHQDYVEAAFMMGKLREACNECWAHFFEQEEAEEMEDEETPQEQDYTLVDLMNYLKGSSFTQKQINDFIHFLVARMKT